MPRGGGRRPRRRHRASRGRVSAGRSWGRGERGQELGGRSWGAGRARAGAGGREAKGGDRTRDGRGPQRPSERDGEGSVIRRPGGRVRPRHAVWLAQPPTPRGVSEGRRRRGAGAVGSAGLCEECAGHGGRGSSEGAGWRARRPPGRARSLPLPSGRGRRRLEGVAAEPGRQEEWDPALWARPRGGERRT